MTQEELDALVARLRRQGSDDAAVEAKSCARGLSKSVWETVSAFANTSGGTIVLGLSEQRGFAPVPGFDRARVLDQLITGLGDGDPGGACVEPCPEYLLDDTLLVDGAPVVVAAVSELDIGAKPCRIARRDLLSGCYKRVGDHDVRLSAREIFSLQNALRPSGADLAVVGGAGEADLSPELVRALLANPSNERMFRGTSSDAERLVRANVMDREGGVTLAGLLTCGAYPQQFHPRLLVDVAVHAGVRKSDPSARERFLDRVVCEGSTGEVIELAYGAVLRNLRTYSVVEGAGRRDEHEIPGDAIREALANAVVHREYDEAFLGQSVQVDVYSDRVEVTSPGGLWGGKTLANLDDGVSECRNRTLMQLMSRVPQPGTEGFSAEGNGTGIILMRRAMAERALEAPEFEAGFDYFRVTLRRAGAELRLARGGRPGRAGGAPRSYWPEAEWRSRILELLLGGAPMTVAEVARALGRREEITAVHLRRMASEGLVVALPGPTRRERSYALDRGAEGPSD